jgi:hypothetical protein
MMLVQFKGPPKAVVFDKAALRLLEVPMGQRKRDIWTGWLHVKNYPAHKQDGRLHLPEQRNASAKN